MTDDISDDSSTYRFGTIMVDPPWAYYRATPDKKLKGYVSQVGSEQYPTLVTQDLIDLPVGEYASDDGVLLLWCVWPFIPDALKLIEAWGYKYITALPWVKVTVKENPIYGVGYWTRGCSEVILIAKRPKAPSVRTDFIGLISPSFKHSKKPDSIYELAERFPGPRLEIFSRDHFPGWYALGNEAWLDGGDIRDTFAAPEVVWDKQRAVMEAQAIKDYEAEKAARAEAEAHADTPID